MKPAGYLVMESSEDFEQALRLVRGTLFGVTVPPDGVLIWRARKPASLFLSREEARAAIVRTDHFRRAFGFNAMPEKQFCNVVPIERTAP